jgi:ribosomal protein S18 acetylase RimI-like enzyme
MTQLSIRPLAAGEEAAVIALWHACGLTRPWNDPAQDLAFARGKPNSDILVGLADDNRIVASAMVGHDGHRGTMYYVSVDPARQGRGYGRQMVAAAEAWLKERGVWKANLLVRKGNEKVLGFYGGLGYETGSAQQIEKWIDPAKRGDR